MSSLALPMSAWPVSRKVAAWIFGALGLVGLACAAVYLSAVLFLVVKGVNRLKVQQPVVEAAPVVTKEEVLLTEIRDILARRG